ncbi:MAG: magnesium transporter [Planctomycetota bacterium]|jgi:magnesium transporter
MISQHKAEPMKTESTGKLHRKAVSVGILKPRGVMRRRKANPGARPGIEHLPEASSPPQEGKVTVSCLDYGSELYSSVEVDDLDAFLKQDRPEGSAVRWINVNGLHAYTINRLQEVYSFHPLAAEDALHTTQRSKVEVFDNHLFIVAQMLMEVEGKLVVEQVSFMLFEQTLITFQERAGDVWDRVRNRIRTEGSQLRKGKVGYLVYALLDGLVDNYFPALEHYGDALDEIETQVLERPTTRELQRLYLVKQEMTMLRRLIWPTRQMIDDLQRTERKEIDKKASTYLRDVYDHAFQVIDLVEAYRETASSLTDLYMSSVANRMNEVMKVLTIMASLFIPITFLAGVYGMNFEHIPELSWPWAYAAFWGTCLVTTAGLLYYFRRKGWIGTSK